jgi:hypothetical protein
MSEDDRGATSPDDELDASARAALGRWQPPPPPASFADRVLAAAAEAAPATRRRARWPLVVAGVTAAAAAAVAVMAAWPSPPRPGVAVASRAFAVRETVALAGRGVAVIEPGTTLGWRRDGNAVEVHQDTGDVFYRVDRTDRGAPSPFAVTTPAGRVEVTGTCFRVEVIPMKPSRASLLGAAAGAVIATAAVVTVYEGKVLVASPAGKAEVKAGEHVTLDGTTPSPQPAEPVALAVPVAAEPSSTITREELLVRDRTQREQIAALGTRLQQLEGAIAAAGGKVRVRAKGPELDENWLEPSKEDLLALARTCGVKIDIPPVMRGDGMQIGPEIGEAAGLGGDELVVANQVFADLQKSWLARVRGWYIEATGDRQGADLLSAHAMGQELEDKALPGEPQSVRTRISQERAGLAAPPRDTSRLSPYERYFRALAGLGDEAERLLADKLGAAKAHGIRAEEGGWPMRMSMSGCGDDQDGDEGGRR